MKSLKYNVSTIVKLILNHVISAIYSLMLLLIFYSVAGGRFLWFCSALSIAFYLGLIYSFMWNAGAKDANSFYSSQIKKGYGFLLISVATLPSIITNLISIILSLFKTDAEFAEKTSDMLYPIFYYINCLFTQVMYTGLFAIINNSLSGVSPLWFLLSIIPAVLVGGFAYNLGFKSFRIRTLFGIKYDENKEKIKNNY